jgi:hypothetical protein
MVTDELTWAPQACTLPTAEQPMRVAEFGALFTTALLAVYRRSATSLCLVLDSRSEARVRDLVARESQCCSVFAFAVTDAADGLHLDVQVPITEVAVLDALAERAAKALGRRGLCD